MLYLSLAAACGSCKPCPLLSFIHAINSLIPRKMITSWIQLYQVCFNWKWINMCSLGTLIMSQYWFRWCLGAGQHQAITCINVDWDHSHTFVSLKANELTHWCLACICRQHLKTFYFIFNIFTIDGFLVILIIFSYKFLLVVPADNWFCCIIIMQ